MVPHCYPSVSTRRLSVSLWTSEECWASIWHARRENDGERWRTMVFRDTFHLTHGEDAGDVDRRAWRLCWGWPHRPVVLGNRPSLGPGLLRPPLPRACDWLFPGIPLSQIMGGDLHHNARPRMKTWLNLEVHTSTNLAHGYTNMPRH